MPKIPSRIKFLLKWTGLALLLIAFIYIFFTVLFKYIAPFVFAFLIMLSVEKLVVFLEKRLKFKRSLASSIAVIIFFILVGGLLVFALTKLIIELWKFAYEISRMDFTPFIEYLKSLLSKLQNISQSLPKNLELALEESLELDAPRLSKIASQLSSKIMSLITSTLEILKLLPNIIIFIVIMLLSAYFMSKDRFKISKMLSDKIPENFYSKISKIKNDMLMALAGFLKAQFILMLITFFELFIGYLIIGVDYAFFFALITATIDILPILGVGTILIPASLVYLILGNVRKGLGFILLYIVIFIVRQIVEPRIVSYSLGLHPLGTLLAMYIGLKTLGLAGVLLGPVILIVIKAIYDAGLFPVYKEET